MTAKAKKPSPQKIWIRIPRAAHERLAALAQRTGRTMQRELAFAVTDYMLERPSIRELPPEVMGKIRDNPGFTARLLLSDWEELRAFAKANGRDIGVEVGLAILDHVAKGPRMLPEELAEPTA